MKTREQLEKAYTAARGTMIAVFAFTCINIVLQITNAELFFLFSASLPQLALFLDATVDLWTREYTFTALGIALAFVAALPYIVFWFASSKSKVWILAALIYFAIDLIVLIVLVVMAGGFGEFDVFLIIELVFLAWILISLAMGTKAWLDLKKMPPTDQPPQNHL
ncbi:MAG: hypothetical protein FWE44_04900 [Defluviitaleaceae bacterium]|nr:hypothetical protein [Defluviitaleaceae bacterium]